MNDMSANQWAELDFVQEAFDVDFSDITGPNGPPLWDAILDRLGCPGAVVAGGAVRDYLLGVPPKDIDIFVCSSDFCPPAIFQSLWDDERREEYDAMPNIDIVMRAEIAGFQVDLVVITHPQFTADRENKTVTLLLNDRRERAQRRFDRFNERMGGDWTLVERAS